MKELKLKYRRFGMWMTRKVTIPESWHEMTPEQFLAACKLYMQKIDERTFLKLFFHLPERALTSYEQYYLVTLIEFVRDCRQPHNEFFLERLSKTDLYAPSPRLKGMSLQQFMTADTYFSRYAMTENEQYLNLFIASLYLPKGTVFIRQADMRVPSLFKKMPVLLNMDKSMPVVKKLPEDTKFAIFMNFILIKSWLGRMFPYLFPSSGSSDNDTKGKPKAVDWLEIFDGFVGDHVADMAAYQRMEVMDAFRIMNKRIKDSMK